MKVLTWRDVLENEALIGGELEGREGLLLYRGPLTRIEEKGDLIFFHTGWCAQCTTDVLVEVWTKMDDSMNVPIQVTKWTIPQEVNGEVIIQGEGGFSYTLRPKGSAKLDPKEVMGL